MAHDGSIVAQVEDWMIASIKAGDPDELFKTVDHYPGTRQDTLERVIEELFQHQMPLAMPYSSGGVVTPLSAYDVEVGSEYHVWIAVDNPRGAGAARLGESATVPGIHLLREIVVLALHGKHTGAVNGRLATNECVYLGYEEVLFKATQAALVARFKVPEVPPSS